MKRILSVFLCLIFIYSIVSCDKKVPYAEPEATESTSQEVPPNEQLPADEQPPYTFISAQERLIWKDKIITAISDNGFYDDYEVLQHNFLGMALMDLNFDNTPELIAAYGGGSMGNVCIVAYDLESGEHLCVLGETPHYGDWNNVYFCLHRNNDGDYILVNEGSLRDGLEWYLITSKLTEDFNLILFSKRLKPRTMIADIILLEMKLTKQNLKSKRNSSRTITRPSRKRNSKLFIGIA